ncbi:hypothetical protein EV561_112156 [Rhizobium sp. BK376]|jgi:hypothetical protein|nr:hypothetical protein EV561_112156 [Rhizobium sp. BK376]
MGEIFTSPLRGEVARNARVGGIATRAELAAVTPPRTFGPTLPLKGKVGYPFSPLGEGTRGDLP